MLIYFKRSDQGHTTARSIHGFDWQEGKGAPTPSYGARCFGPRETWKTWWTCWTSCAVSNTTFTVRTRLNRVCMEFTLTWHSALHFYHRDCLFTTFAQLCDELNHPELGLIQKLVSCSPTYHTQLACVLNWGWKLFLLTGYMYRYGLSWQTCSSDSQLERWCRLIVYFMAHTAMSSWNYKLSICRRSNEFHKHPAAGRKIKQSMPNDGGGWTSHQCFLTDTDTHTR